MTRTPPRYTLLIAVSLLTAGLAIAGSSTSLAAEANETTVVREDPHQGEAPRNLTLEGVVTSAGSDEPVAGAELRIYNVWTGEDGETKGRDLVETQTDERGAYSANVSRGEIDVRIEHPDHQRAHAEFTIEDDLELDVPLEPVSEDRAHVEGTVASEGGEPIEDAYVRVFAVPEGCDDARDCDRVHHTARASEGSAREVETEQGSVEIHYQPREDRYVSTRTSADGSYAARVPAGTYAITANAEDHLSEETTVEAPAGETSRADLSLTPIPPDSVTVEGQVVDEETGEPIEHADVRLDNQRWGTRNATATDEDGRFQLTIQPGYTTLHVRAGEHYYVPCAEPEPDRPAGDGGDEATEPHRDCDPHHEREQAYLSFATTLEPEAGETIELEQALRPEPQPDTRIEGWVVNASSGEGVGEATLHFANEETSEWGRAETGEDGSFQVGLDEGYYTVRIQAEDYFVNATTLEVDGADQVRLQLTPGQPAGHGCCYRAYEGSVAEDDVAYDEAGASDGSTASQSTAPSSSGEQTYAGGPAELGSPPATLGEPPAEGFQTPGVGLLGLLSAAAMTALAAARLRD